MADQPGRDGLSPAGAIPDCDDPSLRVDEARPALGKAWQELDLDRSDRASTQLGPVLRLMSSISDS
jgi:hypothetical protein